MQRDREYLVDILDAARLAMEYTQGKTREEFLRDLQCQDAVVRRLEIIGEAARRVSDEMREANAHLPWHRMIGMRNAMIHEYDDIDMPLVWETVKMSLPDLARLIEKIVAP